MTTAYGCLYVEPYLDFAEIVAGSYDPLNPDEHEQRIGISKVEKHEDFNVDTLENDICIITLASDITLQDGL